MVDSIMTFFKGDELLAVVCILPLVSAVVMVVIKTLIKLTLKMFSPRNDNKEQYVDAEYHKEITTELFVPPTQIDTPY